MLCMTISSVFSLCTLALGGYRLGDYEKNEITNKFAHQDISSQQGPASLGRWNRSTVVGHRYVHCWSTYLVSYALVACMSCSKLV